MAQHESGAVRTASAPPHDAPVAPAGKKPASYTAWSIVMFVLGILGVGVGNLPCLAVAACGIVALVNSSRVDNLWVAGAHHAAQSASRRVRALNIVALVLLLVAAPIYQVLAYG